MHKAMADLVEAAKEITFNRTDYLHPDDHAMMVTALKAVEKAARAPTRNFVDGVFSWRVSDAVRDEARHWHVYRKGERSWDVAHISVMNGVFICWLHGEAVTPFPTWAEAKAHVDAYLAKHVVSRGGR